ncbi:hypothetical protein [Leptospira wolffii]|uniref:hypothetical protein n=1 Tax=Leptospira wolffii TaxID=409998 RepID=UPI00031F63C8|nr:hypothetical protein [Leptospira wolffii]EPG65481.1 hypothetical protein LEP1GSC061_2742 [Leptospira wolffii serovar Khorat str. Khorat-H2]
MFLLSQDSGAPILIWPEFSWVPVITGGVFLAVVLAVIYWTQKAISSRNVGEKNYRDRVLAKLHLHEFHNKDVILFHEFLDRVPYGDLRRMAEDPAWYQKYFLPEFLQFLADQSNLPAWRDVQIVHTLDHLTHTHTSPPRKYLPAILQTDSKETFPILLGATQIDASSVNKGVHAHVYTKTGVPTFSLSRYEKVELFFRSESNQWMKSEAIFLSQEDKNLTLQIKTIPELDEKKEEEWTDHSRGGFSTEKDSTPPPQEYSNSLDQILEFSGLQPSVCEEIRHLVKNYREHPGLIRRHHKQEDYKILIRLYKVCFVKFRSHQGEVPKPVLLFVYFFFLDETLISGKRIRDLEEAITILKSSNQTGHSLESKISIHLFPDWLNLVLAGKKHPSNNSLGQTYDQYEKSKLLWNQEPEAKDIRNKEYLIHLLEWEVESLLYMGLLGISLNPNFAYPILSEDHFYGPTQANIFSPEKIFSGTKHVAKIDPGLFQREVHVISSTTNQISEYKKEFYADLILLPFAGNRGVLWQESSEGNLALGRMLFPSVVNENPSLVLTKTLGEFRWETERTLQGRKWKEPFVASLTSAYYAYLENYRKNPNLTLEAKKRLEQQWIKCGKNIKDMFSIDYAYWILLEASGKPRLNRVAREILNKYIPIQIQTKT